MDTVSKMIDFETGELDEEETVAFFVEIMNSGLIEVLQGFYGRTAKDLLDSGLIVSTPNGYIAA